MTLLKNMPHQYVLSLISNSTSTFGFFTAFFAQGSFTALNGLFSELAQVLYPIGVSENYTKLTHPPDWHTVQTQPGALVNRTCQCDSYVRSTWGIICLL